MFVSSQDEANLLALSASGEMLAAIVSREDFSFAVDSRGNSVLHLLGAPLNFALLEKADRAVLMAKNSEGDTPLAAVAKRVGALKKEARFVEFLLALIAKCPDALGKP